MSSSLPQVTSFIAEIYDSSSIVLYWDGNSTLDHVSLQKSTNSVKYTTFATDISSVYEYSITGLTSNVYYTFRIIPYDVSGNSGKSVKTNVYLKYDLEITSFYAGTSTGVDMPLYWKGRYYSVDLQYKLSGYDDTAYSDAISIVGTNTYTITGLDENTEYEFKITPKYASGTSSNNSYTLIETTGYTATLSTFKLDNISSFEAVISWAGKYSFIKFQYSTTGYGFKTFSTANSDSGDLSGTITMTDLLPYTRYYFRGIPYNPSFSAGTTSDVVSGETLSGIKKFYASKITQTYDTISWVGSYITAYLYKSTDGGNTYSYLQTYTDTSGSFTDTDVSEYTPYYYYLQPYGETLAGISSELYVLTDYYSTVSAAISGSTTKSISVTINSGGSQFKNALIQISPDGANYYDASLVYSAGETYTLTGANGLGDLSQNTVYYLTVMPYSMYNISGTDPFSGSTATLGSISTFDLSVNNSSSIYLNWSGYYTTSRIEYSTDSTFSSGVTTITIADSSRTINSIDTQYTTYYFRIIPININGVDGAASSILYNPTVNTLYYSNISSSFATLNWSGTNSDTTIQTSTDGSTFSDLSGYVRTTETSATISLKGATVYVRALPYYGNIVGTSTNSIYAPYTKGVSITSITSSPSTISFKINGGVYETVKLQYATSSSSTSYTDISTNIVANTIVVGTSLLPTLNTQNTTYYYTIVPYSTGYQSGVAVSIAGNISSSVFNPSISSIYISDITSATGKLKLNWSGTFSRVVLYESSNNSVFSQIFATSSAATTSYTFTPTNSISSAPNYYKIIPVSDISGVYSDLVYSPVVTDISVVSLSTSSATIGLSGTYENVTIQSSTISSTSGFSDLSTNLSGRNVTFDGLTPASVAYYFRAVPYSSGGGTSSSYKITGVTSSTIYNPVIKTISITNITSSELTLNWTGVFGNVTIQSSTDNSTFSNLSSGNVYINGTSRTLSVSTASTKYYRIVPYYISDKTRNFIPGLNSSVVYNPTINNIYIGSITSSAIGVYWSGTYDYVRLQYSKTGATYSDISSIVLSDNMTITRSHISDLSSQYQTYYFRVVPYSQITNTDGTTAIATGSTSETTYTPTIQSITLSSITSSSVLLSWSGTYNNVTIQSSSDNSVFSDLYTDVTASSKSISTIATNTTYYRIKPYNGSSPSISGITTTAVYIPTVSSIAVTSVTKTPATIELKWTGGTYDKTAIQYSTDNSTFSDLVKNFTGNTTTISSSNISGLNTQTGTYYFRAVPYTYGYYNGVATYDISGVNTSSVYNAAISAISTSTPASNSTNTITVNYTGTYAHAILYYGTIGNITANSITITAANSGSSVTTFVSNLVSNTEYEFELYPYNATDVSGIMSATTYGTTVSTIYGLNLAYDLSLSTAYSVGLSWTNNGYTKTEIYNASGDILVNTFYSINIPYYNSSGVEVLEPNSTYDYYAKVYDSIENVEKSVEVATYTLATADFLDLSYTNIYSDDSITITWTNSGYTTFSIYNYTLYGNSPSAGKIVTVSSASNITSYNSYSDVEDTLEYNKSYVYRVTLTNIVGEVVYTTITATTLASATLSISTETSNFTSSSIPLVVSGSYSGFKIYVNDDSTGSSLFSDYVIFDGSATTNVEISSVNSIINAANNQYSFKLQPYNAVGTYSDIGSSVSAKTLGTITEFYLSSVVDSSSVALYWDGSFASVGIESSTSSDFSTDFASIRYSSSTGGIYNVYAPNQNTKYYFRATPINQPFLNDFDVSGITIANDVSGTTLGTISAFSIGSLTDISASAISLTWDGSFAAINIEISSDGGASYTTLSDTYYGKYAIIDGLTTYSQYYFRGLAINDTGLLNYLPSSPTTAQTLGTITTFYTYSITDCSNITVFYDGSYDAVALETSTAEDFTTDYTLTRIGSATTNATYIAENLEANKKYYFRVRPISYPLFDGVDACGNSVTNDVSGTTYARITSMAIGNIDDVYTYGIPVTWDGSFSEVYIYYSTDGSNYALDVNSPYTENYAIVYNLNTYVQYYFVAIPVNSVGIISDISSSVVTAKTLGTITSFYQYSIVDSSSINIYVDGSYSAVSIECFGGSTEFISRRFENETTGIYYYTGLDANTTYTFLATPLDDPFLDGVDVSGITVDNSVDGTTWGNIISFGTKTVDISSTYIPLIWTGIFNSVFLEYSNNSEFVYDLSSYVVYDNSGTTVRDLSASTLYYFRVTPINTLGVYGATSATLAEYTLGSSATLNVSSNDVYSITLYITGGSYKTADINISSNESMEPYRVYSTETYETLNNSYYTIRDLSANTAYYFTLTPYNAAGLKGSNSNIVTATTLGNLTSFGLNAETYTTTSSTIAVKWSGIYTSVYLEDAANSMASFSPVGYITDTSANVENLAPNTRYYFRATPINSAGNSGITLGEGDISNVTLATITARSAATIGDISANIAFDGSFDTIQLYTSDYSTINRTYGTSTRNSGTDISGLIPLTSYTVYFNSYNLNGVLSDTSSLTFTTLPKISKFAITTENIAETYLPVTWDGSFNSVQFQWSNTSGGLYDYNKSLDAPTRSTNITDLSQNTYYYIVATPYSDTNATGVAGYMFPEISACTLPQLTNLAIDTTQATTYYSIPVSWGGYYKYVVVEYSEDNANFTSLGAIYDNSINLSGLDANKRYYFRATPVNLADVSGSKLVDVSTVTLGDMTRSVSSVYDTSANFILDGSFSSISVYSTPESVVKTYTYVLGGVSTGTDVSGLSPNATYVFTMTPINSVGVLRTDPSYITVRTLPKIYSFAALATDNSNITLTWDGSFDSVDVYMSTTAGSYTENASTYANTTKTTVVKQLLSNKKYYFKIVPSGTAGYGYGVVDVSTITYSTITKLAVSAYYDTSATVAFDGSYSSISIGVNGVTTTYTIAAGNTGTDISNLLPYTTYSVSSTSTNSVITTVGFGTSFTTLPKISSISSSAVDFSSVNIYWSYNGNTPDYVNLTWNKTGTFTSTDNSGTFTSSPIYVSDLSANTRYYFRAIPYGTSGTGYITTTNVLTNANAGVFRASAVYDTSAVITFDGVYSSIDISVNGVTKTYASSSGTTGTDISNLIPNTTYLATSIVKVSDGSTSVGNNTTFTTLPKLTRLSVAAIDNSSVYVSWTYSGNSPSSVTLIWNTTGSTYSTITDSNGSYTSSPAYISGLALANTKYYFQATPVATGGSGYPINDASDVTYGKLTSLYTSAYYDTSAVVAFDGSFTSIDVSANGVKKTYTSQRTTGLDISNLIPGATYSVTTVLRNSKGYMVDGSSISFTTRSKITGFSATAVDSSSISVAWTATGTLSYVTLVWNTTGGSYNIGTDSNATFTTSPAYITGLSLANTRYYFQITPTSAVGDGYVVKDASNVTYAKMTSISAVAYDTSATVYFTGSFATVDVSTNSVKKTYGSATTNTGTDISNLLPNTTYITTTTLYNSANVSVAGNTVSYTTLPKITSATASTLDSSSIQVAWTYSGTSPSSVSIIWNTTGGTYATTDNSGTYTTSPAYITGLLSNVKYYFKVTPLGTAGYGYSISDVSNATGAKFTSFNSVMYDTSATLTFDGSYSYVDISYSTTRLRYYYPTRTTGTDISNLAPDLSYSFTATMYNVFGITTSSTKYTYVLYTLPKLTKFTASSYDGSGVSLIVDGSFTSVTVQWNTSGTFYSTDLSASITSKNTAYIVNGLYPYTKYYFRATPVSRGTYGYTRDASASTLLDFSGVVFFLVSFT